MAESATILDTLDRFIEQFKTRNEVESGHKLATENGVATANPAENLRFGQFWPFWPVGPT